MEVVELVVADLKANPIGYFAAGFGYFALVMLVIAVSLAVLGLGMAPGLVLENDTILAIGGGFGMLVYTGGILLFSFVAFPMMNASLIRNLDWKNEDGSVGLTALVNRTRPGGLRIAGFYMLSQLLILMGSTCLYIPGIIAMALTTFAMPIVVLEDATFSEALGKGWAHMTKDPAFHFAVWGLLIVAIMMLYVTFVGLFLIFPVLGAWQYYTYRVAFGEDGAMAWEP